MRGRSLSQFRDATAAIAALNARTISSVELLTSTLEESSAWSRINAVVAQDPTRALREAQEVDERRARGDRLGRLAGLSMTVKDTFDVEGLPASAGLPEFLKRDVGDADVVARVRAEGAIVWGKTNTPVRAADWQTYNALYGTTRNPCDLSRTPGGSSGGSAAALAAGITLLEIGADIAGSIRIPAGFCGVFGHKPTFGAISQRGLVPPSENELDLAVVGPMARSARDLELLFSILTRRPFAPVRVELDALRVGLWLEQPGFDLDPLIRSQLEDVARELGGIHVAFHLPFEAEELLHVYTMLLYPIIGADTAPAVRALYEVLRGPAKLARSVGAGRSPGRKG